MKSSLLMRVGVTALLLLALAIGLFATFRGLRRETAVTTVEPRATITTAVAAQGSLSAVAHSYGTVVSSPSDTFVVAMRRDGIIKMVRVREGEAIHAGAILFTVTTAPATSAQYAQARSALDFAEQDLARVKRLAADKLATNDQLASALRAVSDAQAQLDGQHKIGADQAEEDLYAPFDGVVSGISANPGERLQANAPLALLSKRSNLIVRLGLEPADAAQITVGAIVHLSEPLTVLPPMDSKLTSVGAMIDPTTRLVNATADIAAVNAAHLTLGMTLMGRVDLPARQGIVIPRTALLEDTEGTYVFTVEHNTAHRQAVVVMIETDDQALLSKGPVAGTRVITAGNAALEDGIAVQEAQR